MNNDSLTVAKNETSDAGIPFGRAQQFSTRMASAGIPPNLEMHRPDRRVTGGAAPARLAKHPDENTRCVGQNNKGKLWRPVHLGWSRADQSRPERRAIDRPRRRMTPVPKHKQARYRTHLTGSILPEWVATWSGVHSCEFRSSAGAPRSNKSLRWAALRTRRQRGGRDGEGGKEGGTTTLRHDKWRRRRAARR